jgi:amino acid adenylation domain-containing protein
MYTEKLPINPHETLDSSSELYHQMIYEWNQTDRAYPKDKTIHQLFEEQAEKTPDHIALVFNNHHMSYKELNDRANQLAHHLRQLYHHHYGKALEGDTLVALLLDRSFDMIISILAVLKSGAAYVPISPEFPLDRINYILEDTKTGFLISQAHLSHHIESLTCKNINIIYADQYGCDDTLKHNPVSHTQSHHLAYVIYTSGTTGKPKGVMIEHQGIANRLQWMQNQYLLQSSDVVLHKTPYMFDVSVWELLWANLYGGTICIAKPEGHKDPAYLMELIHQNNISMIHFVPSMLESFLTTISIHNYSFNSLKYVFCSGEALPQSTLNKFYDKINRSIHVENLYGPTEASVDVTYKSCAHGEKVTLGKAISNIKLYILNSNLDPVDIGQEGELYITGAGLARGYLNLPKLTQEKFIPNPFMNESDRQNGYTRLYKTGDICKWLENAEIEYVGRSDFQVKIRGFRIELGEIESTIALLDEVEQVCVLAKQNVSFSEKYLAAYIVFKKDKTLSDEAISSFIAQKLPHYMIPSIYISLKHFPLTINGKLDRHALPEPVFQAKEDYVEPRNDLERALCRLWQDTLHVEKVGIEDDFFALGGNSILAINVCTQINNRLGLSCHYFDFVNGAKISNIAKIIEHTSPIKLKSTSHDLDQIHHFEALILNHHRSITSCTAYNESFLISPKNKIPFEYFKHAITQIFDKFELLYSNYHFDYDLKKWQRQYSDKQKLPCFHLKVIKKDLNSTLCQIDQYIFNIEKDWLIRFYLIDIDGDDSQKIFISFFHAILDATSILRVIIPEIFLLLDNKNSQINQLSIDDFVMASEKISQSYNYNNSTKKSYWKNIIDQSSLINMTCNSQMTSNNGKQVVHTFSHAVCNNLETIAKNLKVSPFSVLFSLFSLCLGKYSHTKTFSVITNVDERIYGSENYHQIGCLINNVPLFVDLTNHSSLSEFIISQHTTNLESIKNAIPYKDLLEIDRDKVKGIQSIHFNLETQEIASDFYEQTQAMSHSGEVKNELYFELDFKKDVLECRVEYRVDCYSDSFIKNFLKAYVLLVNNINHNLHLELSHISLIDDELFHKIVYEWNQTDRPHPKDKTIHQLFEEQAEKTPDHIALVFNNHHMSYKELNDRANQLAHHLRQLYHHHYGKALEGDTLVALLLDRSFDMIISILAVLKAGVAYVPISPEFPLDRINYILEDTKTGFLISQAHLSHHIESLTCKNINIIYADQYGCDDTLRHNPVSHTQSHHLAYVIYTSGTTGKPKGVMIEHRALMSTIHNMHSLYAHKPSKASFYSSYVFDVSIAEIFTAITLGCSLFILTENQRQDAFILSNFLSDNKIQYTFLPPAILKILDTSKHYSFKLLMYAGESCDKKTISAWINKYVLVNLYAPSETCIYSTVKKIASANDHNCIGQIFCNEKAYILNSNLAPVDIGQEGELYIAGAGLARGYLNLPSLTQEKFIPNPFASESDLQNGYTRLYKTGDICKWLENAEIEYVGRSDFQVKIRGFRIELGEIESTIALLDEVEQVCVLAKQNVSSSEKYLAAYIVFKKDKTLSDEAISSFIAQKLPHYMIPSIYISLKHFPLTINGKLDRQALPEPVFQAKEDYVEPRNDLERALCRLWQDTLHVEKVGIEDDFFALGGNSILAIDLSHIMSHKLSRTVQLSDLFSLKSIKRIIDQNTDNTLLRIFSDHSNQEGKEKVYFIHPAFAGCEVYQPIVQHLSVYYQCVGIENYNLNYREKETSLAVLAAKYLKMLNFQDPNKKINLFGWSLGGLIAAEMAFQLERNGYKQISIIMLDSHINYKEKLKYHPHFNPDRGGNNVHDFVNDLTKNHSQYYRNKVLSAKEAEIKVGSSPISGQLKSTKVFLIRATKNKGYHYRYNNINKISSYCYYVDLPVGHMDIIAELEKNWKVYEQSFQDFDLSKKLNNISRNTLKGWLILYKKRASLILFAIAGSCVVYSMELFDLLLESLEFSSIISF